MNFLRKIVKSSNFWPMIVILVFAVLAGRTLIFEPGYFNMHDDLQMMRQLEMEKCFKDMQIPCRWVPDMGYGYGFPLFNFYPPLPYLVGQIFRIMQFSFVDTAKLTFALSFILSGIAMYFLAKEFFGKWGGVVSSIFYIWAPYHSVDIYVRGAMNEAWALVWFPLILWTSYKLIRENRRIFSWFIGLSLSWVGLLLSHNLMVMIFTPFFGVWCLMFWLRDHSFKKGIQVVLSGVMAFCLTAFFTLPAILDQKYIHVDTLTQGYYEYIAHFATIGQLLVTRFWGYGPSVWGPNDGMPFQIGHLHWILSIVILIFVVIGLSRKKKIDDFYLVILFGVFSGWFAAFMAHQNSTFIWQHIKTLAFVQFPWRFLTLVILAFSFISGSIVVFLEPLKKKGVFISVLIVVLLVILNWVYFLPQGGKMGALTDSQKFSGAAWNLQRTAGIFDYLPETAKENPKDPPSGLVEIINGSGQISGVYQGTNWAKFKLSLDSNSTIRINIFQFPTWVANVDGEKTNIYIPTTENWGRMYLNVPKGIHDVNLKLVDTPTRKFANYLSLFTLLFLIVLFIWGKKYLYGEMD